MLTLLKDTTSGTPLSPLLMSGLAGPEETSNDSFALDQISIFFCLEMVMQFVVVSLAGITKACKAPTPGIEQKSELPYLDTAVSGLSEGATY